MKWMPVSALVLVGFLQGCTTSGGQGSSAGGSRYELAEDRPPEAHVDVSAVPEPLPGYEPRSRGGNKSPYRVLGKSYHVLPSAEGFVEEGIASWYGQKFHGYHTSNGEVYDMYALSAAHKHLPLPGYVRVTNLDNGRKLIVRVNDRGPFHDGRIIDLSYAAAARLGVLQTGTARVRIENVMPSDPGAVVAQTPAPPASAAPEPASVVSGPVLAGAGGKQTGAPAVGVPAAGVPAAGAPVVSMQAAGVPATGVPATGVPATGTPIAGGIAGASGAAASGAGGYVLQVGAFASELSAIRVRNEVSNLVDSPVFLDSRPAQSQAVHRVRVGPFASPLDARRILELLQRARFPDTLLIPVH